MAGIFDDKRMNEFLDNYIPEGEELIAGVHAIGKEIQIRQCFSYVTVFDEDTLVRSEEDPSCIYDIKRIKYATHDIYFGITENYLVFNECEPCKHAYEINEGKPGEFEPLEVITPVKIREFGYAQALKDIISVQIKKGLLGQMKCNIQLENGSYFKVEITKRAGVGSGMPNHAQYTDRIIERLSGLPSVELFL